MINFPTNLDTLTNPASNNTLDSPSHSGQHSDVNDAVEALEAKVGANSSAVNTSHDYKLSGVTGTDKAVSKTGAETLTNKTLTSPVINGAITGTITPPLTFYGANFYAPEGFLLNGKIIPSVTSNNLTVAIKGKDGNDPSATNPVYVSIGGVVRSITSALSKTLPAGTNWCNAGSAELATKEIDYFVYLGYNATDGVVLGFSRIPYASEYDDFSATTTNEKYCAISTITNAAAGDDYVVIGRFAATLSAGAGYTWSVPTFTNKNLKQRPVYDTRKLIWSPVYCEGLTLTFTPSVLESVYYQISGNRCYILFDCRGTTGGTDGNTIRLSYPINQGSAVASAFGASAALSQTTGGAIGTFESAGIQIRRYDNSNYGIGANRNIRGNGVYFLD